jgi:thiamine pyrophosphate-dependent acetolactate synthase large subunit-like protein
MTWRLPPGRRRRRRCHALGCVGIRVEDPADLRDAPVTAVAGDGPVVVEVISAIEMPTAAGGAILGELEGTGG